jgi:hypothetical protein
MNKITYLSMSDELCLFSVMSGVLSLLILLLPWMVQSCVLGHCGNKVSSVAQVSMKASGEFFPRKSSQSADLLLWSTGDQAGYVAMVLACPLSPVFCYHNWWFCLPGFNWLSANGRLLHWWSALLHLDLSLFTGAAATFSGAQLC